MYLVVELGTVILMSTDGLINQVYFKYLGSGTSQQSFGVSGGAGN